MSRKTKKIMLCDFHTHSLLSDGVLLPSELVRRYDDAGFDVVAITDHVDSSNINIVLPGLVAVCKELNKYWEVKAVPGVELTHVPLQQFATLAALARRKGAKVVIGHGESPVEPVIKGTNRSAITAGVDILAHPGRISLEDARLAASRGVFLEITTRKGHSKTNRHVASVAKKASARLVFNSDAHLPEDIPSKKLFRLVAKAAALKSKDIEQAHKNSELLFKRINRLT